MSEKADYERFKRSLEAYLNVDRLVVGKPRGRETGSSKNNA